MYRLAGYLASQRRDELCIAIPSGGYQIQASQLPQYVVLKNMTTNQNKPALDLKLTADYTKARFDLRNGTIVYSLDSRFCVTEGTEPKPSGKGLRSTQNVVLNLCGSARAQWDFPIGDRPSRVRHVFSGNCLTIFRCWQRSSASGFYCDRAIRDKAIQPVTSEADIFAGNVLGLWPCDGPDEAQLFTQVRECSPGCAPYMVGDGVCNPLCDRAECNWDSRCGVGETDCPAWKYDCGTPSPTVPSFSPSSVPSRAPSSSPSRGPSISKPSRSPSRAPSSGPSRAPSRGPSRAPSAQPSRVPTLSKPSRSPSATPSRSPSATPSFTPSASPSFSPSAAPRTKQPTLAPTNGTLVGVSAAQFPWWWILIGALLFCCLLVVAVWKKKRRDVYVYVKEPGPEVPAFEAKPFVIVDPARTSSGEPLLDADAAPNVNASGGAPLEATNQPAAATPLEATTSARDRFLEQIRHFQGNFRDREWRGRRSFFFWRDYMGEGAKYTEEAEARQREYHRRYDGWPAEKVSSVHEKLKLEFGDGALDELEDRYRALYWPGADYVETDVVNEYRRLRGIHPGAPDEMLMNRAKGVS